MKELIALLRRFVPPYKWRFVRSVIYNILQAIFGGLSIAMLAPILRLIFQTQTDVTTVPEFALNLTAIENAFNYYVTVIKTTHGAGLTLLFVGAIAIFATLFKTGFTYLGIYELIHIRNSVVRDIRQKIYSKILSLPLAFFSDEKKGDIISRTTSDVQEVENSVMSSLDMLFRSPILIIVYLAFMLILSWQLTIFVFVLLPIVGIVIGRIGKSLKKHSWAGQNKMGEILSFMDETLSGLRIIKSFNAESKMEAKFSEETNIYRQIQNRLMWRNQASGPVSEFLGTVVIIIVLWFGGTLVINNQGSLMAEDFITYIGLFYSIINPAKNLSRSYNSAQKGLTAMTRIDGVLEVVPSIQDKDGAHVINDFTTAIEYKNVDFSYDTNRKILENINVTIPKGTMVALVGQSGSGKSTFADLLPRFFEIGGGEILVDDTNISDLTMHSLRELIGNVNQDPILFNDTIYNNITFGVNNVSQDDVEKAARIANAHEFIIQTENGYDTVIGDRGSKLSGGQRQRLSIARAIIKNPPILILDEATSALDTESEKLVQEALEKLMTDRTSIVIAHRLSTIKNANMICVFNEGEIVERGTHEELLVKGGIYTKLYQMQNI